LNWQAEEQSHGGYSERKQSSAHRPWLIACLGLVGITVIIGGVMLLLSETSVLVETPPIPPTGNSIPQTPSTPTQTMEPLDYEVIDSYVEEDVSIETRSLIIGDFEQTEQVEVPLFIACVTLKNTDTVSGDFQVIFSVTEPFLFTQKTLALAPSEIGTAKCPAYSLGDWDYQIIPSTKTTTE